MSSRDRLTDWVASKHHGQIIKRTDEPYFNHLLAVAEFAKSAVELGYEIGLCHDLLEDTNTTAQELFDALLSFNYSDTESRQITGCVLELTDVFTANAYPDLSKKQRKKKESVRLTTIRPAAQSVKYGDLIYNIHWMLKFDHKHAKQYLKNKRKLLTGLISGDSYLHQQALNAIQNGLADSA